MKGPVPTTSVMTLSLFSQSSRGTINEYVATVAGKSTYGSLSLALMVYWSGSSNRSTMEKKSFCTPPEA